MPLKEIQIDRKYCHIMPNDWRLKITITQFSQIVEAQFEIENNFWKL